MPLVITREHDGVTQECFDAMRYMIESQKLKVNGHQALLTGRLLKFPLIAAADPKSVGRYQQWEFSWESVAHCCNTGNDFNL